MKFLTFRRNHLIIISLLLSLFLAGCTEAETPMPTASPTVTLLPTATAPPPTDTPTSAPTETVEATATVEAAAQQAAPSGDRAAFVSETYPDNSVLDAGESFTKVFELRNAGSATWNTDYALVRDETNPAGETLGAGDRLTLPQAVGPGETLTLELPLTAPEVPGTYTVYWTLQGAAGSVVPVDGVQRVWATIRVCEDGQDCSAPAAGVGNPSANGGSIALNGVTHDESLTYVAICITVENPRSNQYIPANQSAWLNLDGTKVFSRGGSTIGMPTGVVSCWNLKFEILADAFNQASHITLTIEKLEGNWIPQKTCNEIRPLLMEQYPGLSFECPLHDYYRNLVLPAGMTQDEADKIIMDAITGAIYGPWEVIIK